MSQTSTVVCSTLGTVICPIRGLYSRLVIYDRCKVRKYPNRVLNKSCRPPAGAGSQWAELGRKLRQTYLLTPIFATVTWPYNPGFVGPFYLLRPVSGLTILVLVHPFSLWRRWYSRPHLSSFLRRGPFRLIWALRPQLVLAQACRGALELPTEYLFERLDFCSQHRVRWVAHEHNGAFIEASDYRSPRFKSKPVIPPSRQVPQVPGSEYVGRFGSGPAPTFLLRSKPAQSSSRGAPRGLLAPHGNQDSRPPVPECTRMIAYVRMLTGSLWFVVLLPVPAAGLFFISCAEPPRSSVLAITPSLGYARTKRAWSKNLIACVIAGLGIKATSMGIKNLSVSAWSWTLHVTSLCAPPRVGPRSRRRVAGRLLAIHRTGLAPLGLPSLEMSKSITSPRTGVTTKPTTFANTGARSWLRLTRMQAGGRLHRRHVG